MFSATKNNRTNQFLPPPKFHIAFINLLKLLLESFYNFEC